MVEDDMSDVVGTESVSMRPDDGDVVLDNP